MISPTLRAMSEIERTTMARVTWRLLPFLLLLYIISWLDRVNVGFAKLQMSSDLGLSETVYGFGAGIFFIGYALCEVPSNLALVRFGARRWIARIMITWGLISAGMMFVQGETSFYVMRFLLGVAEAGFLPGIVYYLSEWFPREQRAKRRVVVHDRHPVVHRVRRAIVGILVRLLWPLRPARLAMDVSRRGSARECSASRCWPGSRRSRPRRAG